MRIPGSDRSGLWPTEDLPRGRDNSKHSEDTKGASPGESTGGRTCTVFRYKSLRFFTS
jgi:hypothetical protein